MKIIVRYTTPLSDFTNKRAETIDIPENSTVEDVVQLLSDRYGEQLLRVFYNESQEFEPKFIVARNGKEFTAHDEPLVDEDEIALVAQFAGG